MADPTFPELLHNLAQTLPAVGKLVAALMYLIGFILIFRGLYALKQYGELRTMMSVNADLKTPIILIGVGAVLIFYPTLINVSLSTVYGNTNILSYTDNSNWSQQSNQAIEDVSLLLRLIGYISFFRGWMLMTHLAGQGSPPGTFGKALMHIIGGILLVNIIATWDIIETTLGLGGNS